MADQNFWMEMAGRALHEMQRPADAPDWPHLDHAERARYRDAAWHLSRELMTPQTEPEGV